MSMTMTNGVTVLFSIAFLFATGCSTSEFGGKSGNSADQIGSQKRNDTSADSDNQANDGDPTDADTNNEQQNKEGAEAFENRNDAEARGHDADAEVSEGCRLPANVRSSIAAAKGTSGIKSIFGLLGWGGGGEAAVKMDLKNVDIRDCSWFEKVKSDPNAKFAYVYQKNTLGLTAAAVQSYVEPADDVKDQTTCSRKASEATRSVAQTGVIQCALIPRDKNGVVIEN